MCEYLMNTPAHIIINMTVLGRGQSFSAQIAVLAGSLLPNAPMFWFYFVERIVRNTPERVIWEEPYFHEPWQILIDLFNSISLIGIGIIACWWFRTKAGMALFMSMLMHVIFDFLLHHDDAHHHFLPFSNWRFESPVSYRDPNHYGYIAGLTELVITVLYARLVFLLSKLNFSK